jgi:glycosyl transferase, family 25
MKTYAIALKRSKERYRYIDRHLKSHGLDYKIIDAVDGSKLSTDDLTANCNMEEVNKLRWWLTNGAIGCALSHYACYEAIAKSKDHCALIVEDDAVLPPDIKKILADVEKEIDDSEVILLYFTSFGECKLSSIGKKDICNGSLVYPINIRQTITATAYVIGRKAAIGMMKQVKPIAVAADSWEYYYEKGAFKSFRVHYPALVKIANFKSSIDYINEVSTLGKVTRFVNDYKIPFAFQLMNFIRKRRLNRMLNHFSLTNERSPIWINMFL